MNVLAVTNKEWLLHLLHLQGFGLKKVVQLTLFDRLHLKGALVLRMFLDCVHLLGTATIEVS